MEPGDIFILLQTTTDGLTSEEAASRIEKFGPNKLEHKEVNPILQYLGFMWNSLSWVMEATALVAIAGSNASGKPPDWENFAGIVLLFLANSIVGYMEERQAGSARTGIDNVLVLLIGGIPIAMPTVLSVTLAIAIEEMAAVTTLCSDKTGTLTLNKLIVDKPTIKQYAEFKGDDIILLSAYASCTENQDAIDHCIPFNPVIKRTEITYKDKDRVVRRVTKGMSQMILDLCTRDKTEEQVKSLEYDVDEYARRGLRALAVAVDEVPSGNVEDEGKGFRLIGLLPIYDPPRSDTKETIDRAIELGVQTLKDGPPPGSGYSDVDDLILGADGFDSVYPEHKFKIVERLQHLGHMTGDGVNDAPALSRANVGVAVAHALDAARSSADIVLTEPGLSVIIEAIIGSRQIFQRMQRPSWQLMCAFVIAQLAVTFIAVYANWRFTNIEGCGWAWAGIAWIWNIVWFVPLDFLKFGLQRIFKPHKPEAAKIQQDHMKHGNRSNSVFSSSTSARYYPNRTRVFHALQHTCNFGMRLLGLNKKLSMEPSEMRRFSSVQVYTTAFDDDITSLLILPISQSRIPDIK
ncbi:unnamed protein product [Umbelopsis sp. WA50703]